MEKEQELKEELAILEDTLATDPELTAEDQASIEAGIKEIKAELAALGNKPREEARAKETPKPTAKKKPEPKKSEETPKPVSTGSGSEAENSQDTFCLERVKAIRKKKAEEKHQRYVEEAKKVSNLRQAELEGMPLRELKFILEENGTIAQKKELGIVKTSEKVQKSLAKQMDTAMQNKIDKMDKKAVLSSDHNQKVGEFRAKKIQEAVKEVYTLFDDLMNKVDKEVDQYIKELTKN